MVAAFFASAANKKVVNAFIHRKYFFIETFLGGWEETSSGSRYILTVHRLRIFWIWFFVLYRTKGLRFGGLYNASVVCVTEK